MIRRPIVLALVMLLPAAALAGCFGGEDAVAPAEVPVNDTPDQPKALPEGRPDSAGIKETNKTEEGVGGVDHKHDYWSGRESVEVFNDRVHLSPTPVYPDGDGSSAKSVAYVKLPCVRAPEDPPEELCRPALVYEGAARVDIMVKEPRLVPQCEALNCSSSIGGVPLSQPSAPHPTPPGVFIQVRSAADSEWREPVPLTYDQVYSVDVEAIETDMPHSVRSLWVFRLTTDSTTSMDVTLVITAIKGNEVVDWPGHPDFYADSNSRVVMRQTVTTHMSGVKDGYLYDSGGTWAAPEKLISHGTSRLVVIANVTSVTTATGMVPTGYFLETHDATIIGPEIRFGSRWSDRDRTNDLASYDFDVTVNGEGMDGPYQPSSRWGFRLMATFTDIDIPEDVPEVGGFGIGLCPACFEYTITYDIVVIAIHDPDA